MKRKIYAIFSILVTVGIMGYLFKKVSLNEIIDTIKGMDTTPLLCFFILSFGQTFFRTWRYLLLLNVSGVRVPGITMFLVTIVRNFFSDLLPARIGTLSYVYILTTRLGVILEIALSSFALAFVFDLIAIMPIFLISILSIGWKSWEKFQLLIPISITTLLILFIILIYLPHLFKISARICQRFLQFQKFSEKLNKTAIELDKVKKGGVYLRVFILSMFVRLCKYGSLYFLLLALLSAGWKEIGFGRFFIGISAAELSASLPISGIAGFGAYEGVWTLAFSLLGFSQRLAITTGISHHLITQVYGYSLGAICLLILLLPIFKARLLTPGGIKVPKLFFLKLLLSLIIFSGAISSLYLIKNTTAKRIETKVDTPTLEERLKLKELADKIQGWILFMSNRKNSSFGIYRMSIDGKEVQVIVDTDLHEIYPNISPDKEWIAYARTESLAKRSYSEIWMARPDGTDNHMIVKDGTFPSWSEDGSYIYFERYRSKVMCLNLKTGICTEILPKLAKEIDGYQIVKPRPSKNGRYIAFISDRKGRWNSWLADIETGEISHIGKGCEPTWFPDGNKLVWIGGGEDGTGIHLYNLVTGEKGLIQDLKPPRGHEYYPSISGDGKYLIFSACAGYEHSHESPNYQVYIRPLEETEAIRINFDSFTNEWASLIEINTNA